MHRRVTISIGLLMFTLAWFLPVHENGTVFPQGLPGWQAVTVALSPQWQKGYLDGALWVASALTNLLALAALLACPWRNERLLQLIGCACLFALCLNGLWYRDLKPDLRIGYYLWWLSFGIVSLGCLLPVPKPPIRKPASAD